MNDVRNRERLRRALDLVEQVACEHQSALNDRAAATLNQNPGPIGIGRMLHLGRRCDALERIGREIHELLDNEPRPGRRLALVQAEAEPDTAAA
jgi:hypothetical protein